MSKSRSRYHVISGIRESHNGTDVVSVLIYMGDIQLLDVWIERIHRLTVHLKHLISFQLQRWSYFHITQFHINLHSRSIKQQLSLIALSHATLFIVHKMPTYNKTLTSGLHVKTINGIKMKLTHMLLMAYLKLGTYYPCSGVVCPHYP